MKGGDLMAKMKPSPETKGPQLPSGFGIPKSNIPTRALGWLKENFSSVILPILAVIILGAGIYFYTTTSSVETQNPGDNVQTTATERHPNGQTDSQGTTSSEQTQQNSNGSGSGKASPPSESTTSDSITEAALPGNGVTHLARRAIKTYLSTHDVTPTLTKEHKIYMEDYLKDQAGARPLHIGDRITFSYTMIQNSIQKAQHLTPQQLKHLEIYAARVTTPL